MWRVSVTDRCISVARTMRKIICFTLIALLLVLAAVALLAGGFLFWRDHRPQPASERVQLFDGITAIRDGRQQPRPLVIHVVLIDLAAPGLRFLSRRAIRPAATKSARSLRRSSSTSTICSSLSTAISSGRGGITRSSITTRTPAIQPASTASRLHAAQYIPRKKGRSRRRCSWHRTIKRASISRSGRCIMRFQASR